MKMQATLLLATALAAVSSGAIAQEITFTTEEYAPLNFTQNGAIVGIGPDQVREIKKRSGVEGNIQMMKWSRAIALAESDPDTCVFTTTHTSERDPKFKWIEPLVTDRTVLVKKAGSDVNHATTEDAITAKIGSQTGDYTVALLEGMGAKDIDLAGTIDATMKKLEAGRVDYVPMGSTSVEQMQEAGYDIEVAHTLQENVMSIACSLSTSDGAVQAMQAALDEIIADGTQDEILRYYQ